MAETESQKNARLEAERLSQDRGGTQKDDPGYVVDVLDKRDFQDVAQEMEDCVKDLKKKFDDIKVEIGKINLTLGVLEMPELPAMKKLNISLKNNMSIDAINLSMKMVQINLAISNPLAALKMLAADEAAKLKEKLAKEAIEFLKKQRKDLRKQVDEKITEMQKLKC